MIGTFVVVRTRSAGVHCGLLAAQNGTVSLLKEARRIWRWRGANSLHELSQEGADEDWTRISREVPQVLLPETIEIISCSAKAETNLRRSRWSKA